ncbi:MAG: hypothetical protein JTT11_10900, partial [Candidatus Brockarchaeota archaeon]|nr:hypothetical protein [Candidatus Brockarchaeota archaeon]
GMAVVMDQLSHLVSEPSYRRFILFLGVAGLFGAVTASTFLGVVRSKEMAVQGTLSRQDNPAVIIEGEGPAPDQGQQDATPSPLKDFYEKLGALSLLVMIPLAVAVELVGGIALHEALARIPPARTKLKLLRRRRRLQRQIVACASAIVACEQQPEIAWNEFLQGGLQGEQMRRQLQAQPGRLFVIGLMFLFLVFFFGLVWAAKSFAEEAVVVGVDLTKSSDEELAKNLQAVDSIILSLKSGSRFIVLPITDRSFSQPAILDARLSADPGLFGERLRAEKQQVMRKWRERSKVLKADAKGSDLFGALAKASILFDESPGPKPVLILLSDMRHVGRGYNFEALTKIERALLEQVQKEGLIPSLKGVKVWVLGAHAQGVSEVYWMSLRAFWAEYLKRAGAELITFSPNRRWQR